MDPAILDFSQPGFIITLLFGFIALIQVFYYLFFYSRVCLKRGAGNTKPQLPVSVVVCARNEADYLKQYVPLLCKQDYPDFEVVVVNDCSEDDSYIVLKQLAEQFPNLKVTTIKQDEKFSHGKKLALTVGIKAAKNDVLLFTDADCKPISNKWIQSMAAGFLPEKEVVLSYSGIMQEKGFLNKLIRYDVLFIGIQYLGFALAKIPYMGVGRNMAYRKSLYISQKGFARHAHILSGDDDLFVNQAANSKNTAVVYSNESHVLTHGKNAFRLWILQKRRHFSSSKMYKSWHKLILALEPGSRLLFYFFPLYLILFPQYWPLACGIFAFRLFTQLLVLNIAMNRLGENKLLWAAPFFDFILPIIHLYLLISNKIKPIQQKWR